MVMDYVRSCYSTKMRFFNDDPSRLSDVQWYFADPGASIFPGHHRFASLNWSSRELPSGPIGEVAGQPRPYSKGAIAGRPLGTHFDGPRRYFSNGCPSGGAGLNRTASGIPVDCVPFVPNRCANQAEAKPFAYVKIPGDLEHILPRFDAQIQWFEPGQGFVFTCDTQVGGMILNRVAGLNNYFWTWAAFDPVNLIWTYTNTSDPGYALGITATVAFNP
jgi:hypothetical protein